MWPLWCDPQVQARRRATLKDEQQYPRRCAANGPAIAMVQSRPRLRPEAYRLSAWLSV